MKGLSKEKSILDDVNSVDSEFIEENKQGTDEKKCDVVEMITSNQNFSEYPRSPKFIDNLSKKLTQRDNERLYEKNKSFKQQAKALRAGIQVRKTSDLKDEINQNIEERSIEPMNDANNMKHLLGPVRTEVSNDDSQDVTKSL